MRPTGEWLLSVLGGTAADYLTDLPYESWEESVGRGAEMSVTSLSIPLPPGLTRELYVQLTTADKTDLSGFRVQINKKNEPGSGDGEAGASDVPDSLILREPVTFISEADLGPLAWGRISFLHNGGSVRKQADGSRVVPVSGTVYWTANGTDYEQQFELSIPAGGINAPHYDDVQPGQMDSSYHLNVLRTRRGLPPQTG